MSGVCTRLCQQMLFDPGQRRTHSQGMAQSTSLLQGVTEGGTMERRRRSQRDRERVSHHYCHSVTHSGHSVSPSVCGGPGRLVGDTLPFLPSIHPSIALSFSFYTSHRRLFYLYMPRGFRHALFITAIHHSHSCQSSHTGPSLRLRHVLFYIPAQSPSCPWVKDSFP